MSDKETAISKIDEAVSLIEEVRAMAAQLHIQLTMDREQARHFESIDDKLHDALAALGQ